MDTSLEYLNSPPFKEPEGSLPHLQEPDSGPYSEPDKSNPNLHFLFL
jgi:hypothetical protein